MKLTKKQRRTRIKNRIRKIVSGTEKQPRLSVFRSNKEIYAQLVDDVNGNTLVSSSSAEKEISKSKGNKTETASLVGKNLAEKAVSKGIKSPLAGDIVLPAVTLPSKKLPTASKNVLCDSIIPA